MEDNVTVLPDQAEETLYSDVCQIIDGTRGRIATFLNTEVCMTNWYIGKRIKEDVLFNQRAEYGKQVIKNLSLRLIGRYGSGWSEKKLRHCIRSAETFSELHAIARQKVSGSKIEESHRDSTGTLSKERKIEKIMRRIMKVKVLLIP